MKAVFIAFFFLAALTGHARAQSMSSEKQHDIINAQRAAISAERAGLEAGFLAQDAVCYKKFAVNNCLADVNARRRESMASLRRREIELNDEERKIKGAEQLNRTEEKSSPEKQQDAVERSAKASEEYKLRLERETNKKQERSTVESNEKTAREANAEKLLRHQKKTDERNRKQAAAVAEATKYAERQNEAVKRRAEHEADLKKQTKPPAKPLPMPEL